jgi:hypothetical protein
MAGVASIASALGASRSRRTSTGRAPHLLAEIGEEIGERRQDSGMGSCASAGVGANERVGVSQQLQRRCRRKRGLEPRGGRNGDDQRWALHRLPHDNLRHRAGSFAAANLRKRLQGGDLLGHQDVPAKAGEPEAELLQRRNGGGQPAARRLLGKRAALGKRGVRDCGDERCISESFGVETRNFASLSRLGIGQWDLFGKEIELPVVHERGLPV